MSEAAVDPPKLRSATASPTVSRHQHPPRRTIRRPGSLAWMQNGPSAVSWQDEKGGKLLPDDSVTAFLVGYQDPDTPGSGLKEGKSTITIDNQPIAVRAKVRSFGCFSAHGDSQDIDTWLAKIRRDAKVVLVHGDKSCLTGRREQLTRQGWKSVLVAEPGVQIDLLPAQE